MKRIFVFMPVIMLLAIMMTSCGAVSSTVSKRQVDPTSPTPFSNTHAFSKAPKSGLKPGIDETGEIDSFLASLDNAYADVSPSIVSIRVFSYSRKSCPGWCITEYPRSPLLPSLKISASNNDASGIVWDQLGHIVTNAHVINGASDIQVTFNSGLNAHALLVGEDTDSDLAVLQVNVPKQELHAIQLGNSDGIQIGQLVISIANSIANGKAINTGVVIDRSNSIAVENKISCGDNKVIPGLIRTNAPLNTASSGSALVDIEGRLIGVILSNEASDCAQLGESLAIPTAYAHQIVRGLIENGYYAHPWIGIKGISVNASFTDHLKHQKRQQGVLVLAVSPGSPADEAGLRGTPQNFTGRSGDLIIEVDGHQICHPEDLIAYLESNTSVGDAITLTLLRNGIEKKITLILTRRPYHILFIEPTKDPWRR